jgi:hypothetical protein
MANSKTAGKLESLQAGKREKPKDSEGPGVHWGAADDE